MSPLNPLALLACLALALAVAQLIAQRFGAPQLAGRHAALDGLRGYLAFGVFLHHATVWYFYLQTGSWTNPPSALHVHLGQGSVSMFFMLTGFLFFGKLRRGRVDWLRLYADRVLRLAPLYLFAIGLLLATVALLSAGTLRQPPLQVAQQAARWLGFTILGNPDVNGVPATWKIVAGVTWSLVYEWMFYLALPLLALATPARPPLGWLVAGLIGAYGLLAWNLEHFFLLPFAAGIAAAVLAGSAALRRFAAGPAASLLVLALLGATSFWPTAYAVVPQLLLGLAFLLIAGGATLFGALVHPAARQLGETTYSIYLLHGILLFATFELVIGRTAAQAFTAFEFWCIIGALVPLLVLGSYATFRCIESPPMAWGAPVVRRLRAAAHFIVFKGLKKRA